MTPDDDRVPGPELAPMPTADLRGAFWHQEDFYADPSIGFDPVTLPMRLAVMLTPLDTALPQDALGGIAASWTFFAGSPSRPVGETSAWPRRAPAAKDGLGVPLTHVVQVDLDGVGKDQGDSVLAATGLPTTGLLQFFTTWRPTATRRRTPMRGPCGGYRAPPAAGRSLRCPRTWSDRSRGGCARPVPLAHEVGPTVPDLSGRSDLRDLPVDVRDRYARIRDWMEEHPYDRNLGRRPEHLNLLTPWDAGFVPLPTATRLLGFSAVPASEDYDRLVRQHLPLEPGDEHVLLADVNPLQLDEVHVDWFHGGRHVEYWIRRSDLLARDFGSCWALIRTDH